MNSDYLNVLIIHSIVQMVSTMQELASCISVSIDAEERLENVD